MTMRKITALCFVLLLLASIGYGEGTGMKAAENDADLYAQTEALLVILHAHSNLGMELLSKAEIAESAISEYVPGQRNNAILPTRSEDKAVWGSYSRYPYNAREYRLTEVSWSGGEIYHVFGIHIGDSLEKARDTMAQYGYMPYGTPTILRDGNGIRIEYFTVGKIIIRFTAEEADMQIYHIEILIYEEDAERKAAEHNAEIYAQTQALVDVLHMHSDLGMELLSKSRIPESEIIEYIPGQTHESRPPDVSVSEDKAVWGFYFRYPYYARDYRLINVEWNRGETHHVFGIHIGDSLERARETLAQYGYVPYESPYSFPRARDILREQFANDKVIIWFDANTADMQIRRISITINDSDPNVPQNVRH